MTVQLAPTPIPSATWLRDALATAALAVLGPLLAALLADGREIGIKGQVTP